MFDAGLLLLKCNPCEPPADGGDLFQFRRSTYLLRDCELFFRCQPVGSGQAAFKYLAPYIFRVAISNKRILKLEDGQVTFSYKESATDQVKFSTVSAEEFIRRFLQHVLPDHFVKVRYYGLLSPANRQLIEKARELLDTRPVTGLASTQVQEDHESVATLRCPTCGSILKLVQRLKPQTRLPP